MKYLEARTAAVVLNVGYEGIAKAVKRGSDQYPNIYIKGNGRGGKKLLIGVSDDDLMEALRSGVIDNNIDLYDDCGIFCSMEDRNTLISNSKNEKEVITAVVIAPNMKPYLNASPDQRTKTLLKMEVVEGYDQRDRRISAKEYIQSLDNRFDPIGINEAKLFRWKKAVDDARKVGESPLVALLDTRGRAKGSVSMSEKMQEMAVRMFARRDNPLRVSAIYQNMLHEFGEATMCSYDVLNNFINQWKIKNHSLYAFAQSADKWKNTYLPAMGSLSEKALYPNHYWELDSTPADIICRDGKRYAILGMIDIYSRRCVFWVDERSSSYSIARLLRKAILRLGIPENVVVDNGKDYQSNHFDSICYNLGIAKVTVPPFSGDMKPHIERMFGTLSRELFEELDGYIGHSVAERSAIQSRRGFAHKIESQAKWREEARKAEQKEFENRFAIKKSNLGLELKLPIEADQLQKIIDKWCDNIYEHRGHSGIKDKTPVAKWKEQAIPVKGISDSRMLDLLLGESFERKVGKKGIRLDGALYQHVALAEYVGEIVRIMTHSDMGYVSVYRMNYEPICVAEDYEYMGKSRAELAEGKRIGHRIAREYAKLLETWEETSRRLDPTIRDRIEASMEERSGWSGAATIAVSKTTETIRAVSDGVRAFAMADEKALEESNIINMNGEKLLPSGRPTFNQLVDRFMWDLEHDMVDESTDKLKQKQPDLWDIAYREHERKKIG
ncbi:transposase family protein [Sulfuricurvum sp.]|uniref:transposase family protein n=1 Tax=Sulfuricurvum sp. TaxID=2025608 RepID=UPI00262CA1F9|nr:transposase family protein [Sulfuricurvum sp.]MDD2267044.1 transposase family protein [Sulfuricurvum sp.]MDD2784951.1 transposase family protein [Sulfuricurvum sp.]